MRYNYVDIDRRALANALASQNSATAQRALTDMQWSAFSGWYYNARATTDIPRGTAVVIHKSWRDEMQADVDKWLAGAI